MRRTLLIFLFGFLLCNSHLFAQVDEAIFKNLDSTENDYYKLYYPKDWRPSDFPPNLNWLEGSGIGFQFAYGGNPVIIVTFVFLLDGKDFESEVDDYVKGYRENKDRVFPDGFKETVEDVPIGEYKSKLISTRFYRKSKDLEQSRFDLLVQNSNGYIIAYGLSVQYADNKYKLEERFELKEFAKRIFSLIKPK